MFKMCIKKCWRGLTEKFECACFWHWSRIGLFQKKIEPPVEDINILKLTPGFPFNFMMTPWNFSLFCIDASGKSRFLLKFWHIPLEFWLLSLYPREVSIDILNRGFQFFSGKAHCRVSSTATNHSLFSVTFPEKNLRAEGQLFGVNHKHYSGHYFVGLRPEDIGIYGKIDDDHVPFMEKGKN